MGYSALFMFHESIFYSGIGPFFAFELLIAFFSMQFNARSESIKEKVSFRRLIQKNRCLAAVEGYGNMVNFDFYNLYFCHPIFSVLCVDFQVSDIVWNSWLHLYYCPTTNAWHRYL